MRWVLPPLHRCAEPPVTPSGPGLVCWEFFVASSAACLVISVFKFSIFSWLPLGRSYVSGHSSISSGLSSLSV